MISDAAVTTMAPTTAPETDPAPPTTTQRAERTSEELSRAERHVVLRPEASSHAHDEARDWPGNPAEQDDVRSQCLGGYRSARLALSTPAGDSRKSRASAIADTANATAHQIVVLRGIPKTPLRPARHLIPVVSDDEEDDEHADRGHRHRPFSHPREWRPDDRGDRCGGNGREQDRRDEAQVNVREKASARTATSAP